MGDGIFGPGPGRRRGHLDGRADEQAGEPGRDSPIIGAGTYASSRTVAVSCTGTGEVSIRGVAAYDISALIEYTGALVGGSGQGHQREDPGARRAGGAIALDPRGVLATPHSTPDSSTATSPETARW